MANKESLFLTAAKKVYQHYRPAMWRTLYRTMHKMDSNQQMSQWQATWTISLMGALMMQYGRRTKKLAREYPQFKEGDVLDEEYILSLPEEQQEIADQINRRTEFQVLSIDYQMY